MAIHLTATNQKLKVITNAAVQTQVVASGRDNVSGAQTPISQDTNITTATTTDIVSVPGASTQRLVDDVEINIVGSGSQQVTVQKDVGGTVFQLVNILMQTGMRLHYTNDQGWRTFSATGSEGNSLGYSLIKAPTLINSGTTGTYTPSVNCTAILLELWGAGGQGGGSGAGTAANSSNGSGGSAGCYSRKFLQGVPSSWTYSIGPAGSGAAGTANGNAGSATTALINGITYTANGGPGGLVGTIGTTARTSAASPAAGSVAGTNCDEALAGQIGAPGLGISSTAGFSGQGGACSNLDNGSPGMSVAGAGNGSAATGNGNGGSGGSNISVSTQTGGVGTLGAMRVWEFTG